MSDEPIIQAKAIPQVDGYENRGGLGMGFVYFSELNYEGQNVRVGWVGPSEDDLTGKLFPANWGTCHPGHFAAAWECLAEAGVHGFEISEDEPEWTDVWIDASNGYGCVALGELKELAQKEHRAFANKLKRLGKAAK